MSGICAIFRRDGRPVDPTTLDRMTDAMARRGPDGRGTWRDGPVGLGQQAFWTTPEAVDDKMPLASRDGRIVITADARIHNGGELFAALGVTGTERRMGDGALILRAYERWGTACPEHLLGDFAFVIWDARERQLFCVRDPLGCKLLYYHLTPDLLVVATEISALHQVSDVPRRVNDARVADYLVQELEAGDRCSTFYEAIYRIEPACALRVQSATDSRRTYWALDPTREVTLSGQAEYEEVFADHFRFAVRARLRSRGDVGVMLSGGNDSGAVACIARQMPEAMSGGSLRSYSAVYRDESACPETRHLKEVLAGGGIEPRFVYPDEMASYLGCIDDVLSRSDDLFDNLMIASRLPLWQRARQDSVRVMLDGMDGDLTTGHGTGVVQFALARGDWRGAKEAAGRYGRFFETPAWRLLAAGSRGVLRSAVPERLRLPLHGAKQRIQAARCVRASVLHEGMAGRTRVRERLAAHALLEPRVRRAIRAGPRGHHYRRLVIPWLQVALERYERVASAVGVEARHPFLDRRLIEFCLACPIETKTRAGWPKSLLRHAMAGVVPDAVRWRATSGNVGPAFWPALWRLRADWMLDRVTDRAGHLPLHLDGARLGAATRGWFEKGRFEDGLDRWLAATLVEWAGRQTAAPGR